MPFCAGCQVCVFCPVRFWKQGSSTNGAEGSGGVGRVSPFPTGEGFGEGAVPPPQKNIHFEAQNR